MASEIRVRVWPGWGGWMRLQLARVLIALSERLLAGVTFSAEVVDEETEQG